MLSISHFIDDYTYTLPDSSIARYPLPRRDESKLLVYNQGIISQNIFYNLPDFIPPGGLLVANNSRVVKARFLFQKDTGATIEVFLLEPFEDTLENIFSRKRSCSWVCTIGNLKKWKDQTLKLTFENIELFAQKRIINDNSIVVDFSWVSSDLSFSEIVDTFGHIPIPPYLGRTDETIDSTRYQTIYSKIPGSVAAPTAGLHLTPVVIEKMEEKNIEFTSITLHVGAGTFKPMTNTNVAEHEMHTEYFSFSLIELQKIMQNQGKITAIGTTSLRALESIYWIGCRLISTNKFQPFVEQWLPYGEIPEVKTEEALSCLYNYMTNNKLNTAYCQTQIMIVPGYRFKMVDRLITNFHQPRSTLLLLVAAFIGNDWKKVYEYALENDFRFLSYGDGSLLIRV